MIGVAFAVGSALWCACLFLCVAWEEKRPNRQFFLSFFGALLLFILAIAALLGETRAMYRAEIQRALAVETSMRLPA